MSLVRGGDTITSQVPDINISGLLGIQYNTIKWKIANVVGVNNRTASSTIISGLATPTNISVQAPNRQVAKFDATFNGYGDYTVGS